MISMVATFVIEGQEFMGFNRGPRVKVTVKVT
jgi:hypothetical protein